MLSILDRENNFIHQDDDNRFNKESEDTVIITTLRTDNPKPVYVTLDVAQLRRPNERVALRDSGMSLVFLKSGMQQVPFAQMVAKMVLSWEQIVTYCERATAPTVFEVGPGLNAKVHRVCLTADLK